MLTRALAHAIHWLAYRGLQPSEIATVLSTGTRSRPPSRTPWNRPWSAASVSAVLSLTSPADDAPRCNICGFATALRSGDRCPCGNQLTTQRPVVTRRPDTPSPT